MVKSFQWGVKLLRDAGNPSPEFDAHQLLSMFTDDRLCGHLSQQDEKDFVNALRRRASGEPLQYILGEWEFMGLPFAVRPGVLIPRQDTEVLCEKLLELFGGSECRMLDLCCGSGCIGVAVAHYNKCAEVTAADISETALEITAENAARNGVSDRVKVIRLDVTSDVLSEGFDYIVSNPPYIKTGDIAGLQKEVSAHEPLLALDGGEDGLEFYRAIIRGFARCLNDGGCFAFEVGVGQARDVADMLKDGFSTKIIKDFGGIERVVVAKML